MRWGLIFLLIISFLGLSCSNHYPNERESTYVGQEDRKIKSLSDREVQGYLYGEGMGLSKVAELNNFPGPKHVLELSDQLDLTEDQFARTEMLFEEMNKNATTLGQRYISAEKELNDVFEQADIDSAQVDSLILRIGMLHAKIRTTHVKAHLNMKKLLSEQQIERYQELRGYSDGGHQHQMGNH